MVDFMLVASQVSLVLVSLSMDVLISSVPLGVRSLYGFICSIACVVQ